MSKDKQPQLFPQTPDDLRREHASQLRSLVYRELQSAAAEARDRGDLDQADALQDMTDDATKIDLSLWQDLNRAMGRPGNQKFNTHWWSELVHDNPKQFSSLRDMIVQFTSVCDAAHQRGERLDDRLFPDPEKVTADRRRRSVELAQRHYHEAGWVVPDAATMYRKLGWEMPVPNDE
jgi:hypothetical protein